VIGDPPGPGHQLRRGDRVHRDRERSDSCLGEGGDQVESPTVGPQLKSTETGSVKPS